MLAARARVRAGTRLLAATSTTCSRARSTGEPGSPLYALVLGPFLMQIVGTSITSNRWLLDTALFTHVGPVPAAGLDWPAMGILTGLGVSAALSGAAAFARRDLAAA